MRSPLPGFPTVSVLRVDALCVRIRARTGHGLCRLQFDKPAGQSEHAHRAELGMRPTRHSRNSVILAHDSHAMATAGEAVVDQPGEHSLTRRLFAVSKILADSTLPVSKGFHALFNKGAVGALVTSCSACTLILDVRRSRKAKAR